MRRHNRPLVVTIEQQSNCPVGMPAVTSMRPMTLLEYGWHNLRNLFRGRSPKIVSNLAADPLGLSVAVQISADQYYRLLGRDPDAKNAIEYLGGWLAMKIIPPPIANTAELDREYSV